MDRGRWHVCTGLCSGFFLERGDRGSGGFFLKIYECYIYLLYIIYTPNLGLEMTVPGQGREQGRFRGSTEGVYRLEPILAIWKPRGRSFLAFVPRSMALGVESSFGRSMLGRFFPIRRPRLMLYIFSYDKGLQVHSLLAIALHVANEKTLKIVSLEAAL